VRTYFDDNKTEAGHGAKSIRGGVVSIAARAINAVIQIGSVLFLARLLSPEDYGLVSMVTSLIGFASIFVDLGTRDAVVQQARITEGEVSALFWVTVGLGLAVTLLVAASAPFIAAFYGEPRLVAITVVSSLTFLTTALQSQPYALLRRALMFREIGLLEVAANLASAAGAIVMAFYGFGYWALVLRPLVNTALLAVGVWLVCRWMPKRPTLTTGVKDMLRFGMNLTGFTMTDFAGRSSDRVAIGYWNGAVSLGHYQNARFVYDNLLDVLVIPLHPVASASLSKVRDQPQELKRLWARALSVVAFFCMPAFGLLAVTGQDVVVLLLGRKWVAAGTMITILALRGIPQSVERTLGWLHVAAGRTDRWMRWGVFSTIVQLLALAAGLPFGPVGVCAAFAVSMFLLFLPAIAYAGQPFAIGAVDVIRAVGRPLAGSLVAAGLGFLIRYYWLADTEGLGRIVLLGLAYTIVYLVSVVGVLGVRAPITVLTSALSSYVPRRFATAGNATPQ
jgi:PST family polysaccharide transporter